MQAIAFNPKPSFCQNPELLITKENLYYEPSASQEPSLPEQVGNQTMSGTKGYLSR